MIDQMNKQKTSIKECDEAVSRAESKLKDYSAALQAFDFDDETEDFW